MSKPCIVVSGNGRCGTSLMMQALAAAGVPCVGSWPDYETDDGMMGTFNAAAFASRSGEAIKLIDPANLPVGDMPNHIVIWLDRDHREQAKSQVKFMSLVGFNPSNRRAAIRAIEADLRKSRDRHRAKIGVPGGCPALTVRFENLIEVPHVTAGEVVQFLADNGWQGIASSMLASQVRRRNPKCYPGFLEEELLSEKVSA